MPKLTWDQVLDRANFIGGDIETGRGGRVYRGLITEIVRHDRFIDFRIPWLAERQHTTQLWVYQKRSHNISISQDHSIPRHNSIGSIGFYDRIVGWCVVTPKNCESSFDLKLIKDLPKDWERLLLLYPTVTFDELVARRVCIKQKLSPLVREVISQFPREGTIAEFLKVFKISSEAEEFLWYYIEAQTGEKDVCERVY